MRSVSNGVLWGSSVCSFLHSTGGPEAEAQAGGSIGLSVQRQRCVCVDISVHAIPVLRRFLRLKIRNGWRMRITTPAVDTRPSFFVFRPIRRMSVVANILREKFGPGDEASLTVNQYHWPSLLLTACYPLQVIQRTTNVILSVLLQNDVQLMILPKILFWSTMLHL